MPTYQYTCSHCGLCKDVFHSMSELNKPSEETLSEITCSGEGEKCIPEMKGLVFGRDITVVAFGKFSSMKPNEKAKVLKKRASEHYKKHIHENKIEMNKAVVKDFKNKLN